MAFTGIALVVCLAPGVEARFAGDAARLGAAFFAGFFLAALVVAVFFLAGFFFIESPLAIAR